MAKQVREWRAEHDVSISDLAGFLGCSSSYLSRVERGERELSTLAKIKLSHIVGIPVGTLFGPEADSEPE